ncbi:NADPH-cytochrome P450 reductase, partial [Rhizoclosmatium hyalinum]
LMRGAGIDATELFMKVHPWVNMDYIMGDKCLVGYLIPESMKTPSKPLSTASTPTSSRPSSGPTQPAAASTPRKERSPSPIQFKIPAPKQPAPMKPSKKSIGETLNSLHTSNKLILFYGTQTGTAKDLSHRLARDVYTHIGVETAVCDLAEYDMSGLLTVTAGRVDKVVVGFLMATYGDGDPTDNAYDFYEWLMDGRGKGADDKVEEIGGEMVVKQKGVGLNYLVFGLGDRTHEQFNAVARRITRRFDAIGAKRVGDVGLGDA